MRLHSHRRATRPEMHEVAALEGWHVTTIGPWSDTWRAMPPQSPNTEARDHRFSASAQRRHAARQGLCASTPAAVARCGDTTHVGKDILDAAITQRLAASARAWADHHPSFAGW